MLLQNWHTVVYLNEQTTWEHCGQGSIRLVHNVPKRPYLLSTLLPSSQDVLFSLCWGVSVSVHQIFFATFPNRITTHKPEQSAGKWNNRPFNHVCWQARGMFHFNLWQPCWFIATISHLEYISPTYESSWKIKIRKVDCLNGDDTRPPGWHNASETTQTSPWCYCKKEDRFQFSVFCSLVIFPLHTRSLGQV